MIKLYTISSLSSNKVATIFKLLSNFYTRSKYILVYYFGIFYFSILINYVCNGLNRFEKKIEILEKLLDILQIFDSSHERVSSPSLAKCVTRLSAKVAVSRTGWHSSVILARNILPPS